MTRKIPVTVLGATGVVGQRFVRRLSNHPSFAIEHLAASERSEGLRYDQACSWKLNGHPFAGMGTTKLVAAHPDTALSPVVFSALDTGPAHEIEPLFAKAGATVFSNASAFRMAEDTPLLVPEVNPEHLELLTLQRARRGWTGGILTNPNCTTTILVMALVPLFRDFGIRRVSMTSMQAVSGAGYPGVPSLDILGNVIPFISGEESKVEVETAKILGAFTGDGIRAAELVISAACHRVPVMDGHTLAVSVELEGDPAPEDVTRSLRAFRSLPQELDLPSAPKPCLRVHDADDRPQVRRDVDDDEGMS
ncbi:MAG: aspartate-semialdehyde dehydrogenase, partial [Planctomycetes bacterium]|nr:aspartate-semialdehyde dehydrogenase [Planctomycetota bacterium]